MKPRLWLSISLVWLGLGLVNATQIVAGMRVVGMHHHWTALFVSWVLSWLVWALATPLVLALARRLPPTLAIGWRGWSTHAAACAAIGVADALWVAFLQWSLDPLGCSPCTPYRYLAVGGLYERFHIDVITYVAILAVGHTIDSLQRLSQREAETARLSAELSKAQLDALRRQIEPHFLFNTLNGISGLVRQGDRDAAVDMIARLSDLLRRVLDGGESQLVPLAEELAFLERYVALQVMRFGDRLRVMVDVPVDLYGALVPNLILQPLVENAILHGVSRRAEGGSIRVGASRSGNALTLFVHNDGPALPIEPADAHSGVGIANTRGRLHTLYGSECTLEIRNHQAVGVETVVCMPYRVAA